MRRVITTTWFIYLMPIINESQSTDFALGTGRTYETLQESMDVILARDWMWQQIVILISQWKHNFSLSGGDMKKNLFIIIASVRGWSVKKQNEQTTESSKK